MIRIGRGDRGLCHLRDLINAPLSIFNGLRFIHHSNSGGGDQMKGGTEEMMDQG